MSAITIGSPAIDRTGSTNWNGYTIFSVNGPASGTGIIDTFSFYFPIGVTGFKIGTAYISGSTKTCRDFTNIGTLGSGLNVVTGKSCSVVIGDYLEAYGDTLSIKNDDTGGGYWYAAGDYVWIGNSWGQNSTPSKNISWYGSGGTPPSPPTNVSATKNLSDKVTVTWTKVSGVTGYKVYEGSNLLATLGDVDTYDDTGAAAPVITSGGSVSASDGTSIDYVALSLSGHSATNGTTYTYKVISTNSYGTSVDSATDTGYRTAVFTYQWQRSAGATDDSYSDISSATTNPYNDTDAPADGSIRYYKCKVSSTGSSDQYSVVDSGYKMHTPSVETYEATSVITVSCNANGKIIDAGGLVTTRGFCYIEGSTGTPTVADDTVSENGIFLTGEEYTLQITGLLTYTHYRIRAYIINSAGTAYGNIVNIETAENFPVVVTNTCSSVTSAGLIANGEILSGLDIIERGFCYVRSKLSVPTINDLVVSETGNFDVGTYSLYISLHHTATYRIRAFARSLSGVGYGEETVTIKTLSAGDFGFDEEDEKMRIAPQEIVTETFI